MIGIRLALMVSLVSTISAHAAPDCDHAQTTVELRECAGLDLKRADAALNAVYGKLLKTLDAEGQQRLREAQRAWIALRDAEADFRADLNRGGTLEPLTRTTTKAALTDQRAKELQGELELRQ